MSRYHKKIVPDANGLIDLYAIAEAFGVKSNPQFHAFKKTIMAGQRGDKGVRQDIDEAIQALQRWKEMVTQELVVPRSVVLSDYGVRKDAPPQPPFFLRDGNGMPAVVAPPKEKKPVCPVCKGGMGPEDDGGCPECGAPGVSCT